MRVRQFVSRHSLTDTDRSSNVMSCHAMSLRLYLHSALSALSVQKSCSVCVLLRLSMCESEYRGSRSLQCTVNTALRQLASRRSCTSARRTIGPHPASSHPFSHSHIGETESTILFNLSRNAKQWTTYEAKRYTRSRLITLPPQRAAIKEQSGNATNYNATSFHPIPLTATPRQPCPCSCLELGQHRRPRKHRRHR